MPNARSTKKKVGRKKAVADNTRLWDERKLGAEEKYAELVPEGVTEAIHQRLGLTMTSIRLQPELIAGLKKKARRKGMKYQTYVRMILARELEKKD